MLPRRSNVGLFLIFLSSLMIILTFRMVALIRAFYKYCPHKKTTKQGAGMRPFDIQDIQLKEIDNSNLFKHSELYKKGDDNHDNPVNASTEVSKVSVNDRSVASTSRQQR